MKLLTWKEFGGCDYFRSLYAYQLALFQKRVYKNTEIVIFCCMLPHPVLVTFTLKGYKFLELGPVFFLCLLVIIGHGALRPLTKTTIAILIVIIFFLFMLLFIFRTPLSCVMKINCISFTPFIILYFWYNIARFIVNMELKIMLTLYVPFLQNTKLDL